MEVNKKSSSQNAIEFDKSYRVMLLRLLYGWSFFELSWLLGYRDFYVRDVENPLHKLKYAPADTNYLRLVFNCCYECIIASKIKPTIWDIIVDETTNDAKAKIYYIYQLLARKKNLLYKVVAEEKLVEYKTDSTADEDELVIYIKELIELNYFNEPKTHLDLFRKCEHKFGAPLKPLYVINAVGKLTGKHGYPKLGDGDKTDMARATLVMLLVPKPKKRKKVRV